MSMVTIGVSSFDDVIQRTTEAFRGKPQGEHISFASVELLWKTLTPRRWALVRAMAGKGPMTMRAAGRLVGHDIKTIHGDVQVLLEAGVLGKVETGQIVFPYDAIHVDFMIDAA